LLSYYICRGRGIEVVVLHALGSGFLHAHESLRHASNRKRSFWLICSPCRRLRAWQLPIPPSLLVDCTPSSNAILACNGIHSTRHQDGGGRSASRRPIIGSRYEPLAMARMSLQPLVRQSAFIGRPVVCAVGASCEERRHASSRMLLEGKGGRPLSEERPQPMQRSLPVPRRCRGRSKTLVNIEAQEQTARWLQALEATTALLRPPIAERSFRRRL
jgi:hypothetical protein